MKRDEGTPTTYVKPETDKLTARTLAILQKTSPPKLIKQG